MNPAWELMTEKMENGNGNFLTPEERELIEAIKNLSIEDQCFAADADVHIGPITFSKGGAKTTVTLEVTDEDGRLLLLEGIARQVVRRDVGDYKLGIVIDLTGPEEFEGRIGEAWFEGSEPESGGFFAIKPKEEE